MNDELNQINRFTDFELVARIRDVRSNKNRLIGASHLFFAIMCQECGKSHLRWSATNG